MDTGHLRELLSFAARVAGSVSACALINPSLLMRNIQAPPCDGARVMKWAEAKKIIRVFKRVDLDVHGVIDAPNCGLKSRSEDNLASK